MWAFYLQDILRKAVYAVHYTDPATGALGGIPKGDVADHVRHCIDVLRQGAMCAGDVTYVLSLVSPFSFLVSRLSFRCARSGMLMCGGQAGRVPVGQDQAEARRAHGRRPYVS